MLNAAIIGVSGFGNVHYNDLIREATAGKVRIAAAAIINQDEEQDKCRILRENGCKIFTDYQEMLNEFSGKLDFVCVPTGINLHAPMAVAAMRAGANAFIEKPAAATLQEIDKMRECEKATGKRVYVGFQHIYQPSIQAAKRLILSGKIGKLQRINALVLWPRNYEYYNRNQWAGNLKSGEDWVLDSPFNNATAHYLNILLFWCGDIFEQSAKIDNVRVELYRANDITSADTAAIQLRTANGIEVLYYCSHAIKDAFGPHVEVVCEHGSVLFDRDGVDVIYADGKTERLGSFDRLREDMFDALLGRLNGGDDFVCDLDIAGQHTLVVNAVHDAAEIVAIPEKYCVQGEDATFVPGLDDLLKKSIQDGKMPAEYGVEWTRPAASLSLQDYHAFKGGKN